MDRQEELLKFLQSKGLYEGVDLQRFKRGLMDEAKAQTLFEAMKSDGSLDADIDYDYWRDYHDIPAAQKKSQAEIQSGLGAASKPSSPLSSGVDFTAPIQDVARQTAAIAEQQRPAAPTPTPTPQRPEMPPRTFAGREIPAPVAPGREEQEIVRQDIAAMQQMQANQLAQQRAQPIAKGREVFGQVQSDFPVKSGDTAIKELEQARKERQAGERQKGIEVSPMFQDKNVPSYGKFFENTRMGKILSQGGQMAGATIAGIGAGALNLPELVANTMENIAIDIAMSPYRKKLQEGKITQEQFNTYRQSARIAAQTAQKMTPVMTPRRLENFADQFLNADELENAARNNLKTVQERIDNSDKGFEGLIKEGRTADAFQYAATQAIGSLPYALTAALPGGVYVVGGVAAQDKYRQIEDEIGAENMGSKETLNAIATGTAEGLSEAVTAGIVKRAGALVRGLGKAGAQKTIAQQIKSLFKATIGSSAEEAVSELAAQLAENIIDKATIKPDKDITEGLIDAVAIGAISGGGITGIAGTIGLAAGRRQAQAQAPGAPTAQTGAAPAPTPPAPGAPTQPPGAPAAAPTAPTRPFGPLGESAPDANVYADEILGTYRPEGGQMTAEEADRMVQDFLDTMLEVDEDEGDVKPPKPGTWEAEVYADVDARRQEIAQAVMALAATPKPTQGAPTEQAAQTPIDRLAREIYDIYGGQELTQEQANNIIDEHLASLTSKNELGETVYSAGYDQVLMAGTQIANKIVELSKQPADATQKVEQVQPQGGERQYTGAQEVQDQAATEAGIGDRAVSGGVQTEAQVTEQERSTKVAEIESRRQDIISRKTTPQEKFEFLESIPEGTIFKNDDDGSAVIVSKKTTSRGAETYELTPIVFNEDTMQWEDNPAGVKIVERKANGEFNLNAELPAIFTSQSSIVFPTDALYQRTLEALKPSVAQPTAPPQEAVAPTAPTATQPEPTAGMPATDLIQDRGIFTINSYGFRGLQDEGDRDKVNKEGAGIDIDLRFSGPSERVVNNREQVWERWRNPDRPLLYLMKDTYSGKTYMVAAMGWLQYGDENGRDGTVFGSIEYKEGMGNDVKRALLDETYKRYLDADSLTQVGNRTRFLRAQRGGQYKDYKRVYDPNMPLSDIDLTGTYQPDAFEGATPTAPTAAPEPTGVTPEPTPTTPTAPQPEPTTPATNLEAAPTQPVQAPEGGLPTEFQEISAEEEAAQEQEMLTLRQGVAELRRKAGRYVKAGIEYVRNPIDKKNPRGKTDEVFFGVRLKVPFVYKAIESNELTPSHLGNNVNPQHFIPESQPKDRTKGSDTIDAQMTIATKPEPTLLGKNPTAYTGAPIVNQRNEVIQGNNRAAGLRLGYRMGKFAPYRQWLIDNAAEFGLDPEQIAAMENPVLVRELNVSDEDAKMYGNWKNSDMESGKAEEVDVITLSARLSDQEKSQIASFLDELTDNMDKTTTRAVITKNADAIVKIISRHISGNERNYIMSRDGKVTVKGYDAIENLFKQLIFDGADPQVRQAYELTMPAKAVAAINKSIKYIFGVPIEARLVDDLQDAFIVFNAFESQRQSENGLDRFDDWLNQPMLFEGSPRDVFTPVSIELARRFDQMNEKKATEAQLINVFRDYQRLVKGVTGGMFGDQKPMTKAEAIKELFNVEYEPKAITEEEVQPQGAEATEGAVGQVATQLGAEQPTGAEMVEGADVEGETTVAEPTPQPIAPPAPVNQTGTLRNPHTKKLYPNRPAGKFLDVSLVSEAELAGFLKAKTPEAKQKLKAQFKTAKRLQKIADMLGVKVYYGDGTTFGKGEAGTTSTSRSDSDPVQRAIYINFEAVKDGTLSHELAHAFLSRSWGKNSETMSNQQIIAKIEQTEKEGIKLKNRLVAILKDSGDAGLQKLSNDIEAWAKMYPAHLRGEEYVVELAARLSEGMRDKIVDNSILAKIERAINAFFDALLGKDQIQVRLTDTKDLIDFINTLSKGVVDGDAKSIDAALELYESGRVTSPRKTIYWKKQEIKDGKAFVRELTNKINAQDNFDTVKDIESIVNKILTQVFSPGRYIVKFNSAADAAGFVENLNIGAKADNKNSIKISKDVAADMAVAINDHIEQLNINKKQIVGENAQLSQYVRDNLRVANDMESAGKDAKTIRMATGWERGVDGKWRYEIPDVQLKSGELTFQQQLSSVIDADSELLAAYPQLGNIIVNINPYQEERGFYLTAEEAKSQFGLDAPYIYVETSGENLSSANSVLSHEIQHAIQEIEGFAQGGNTFTGGISPKEIFLSKPQKERVAEIDRLINELKNSNLFDVDFSEFDRQRTELFSEKSKILKSVNVSSEVAQYEFYRRLSGEVESRNVQARIQMTPEQRRQTLLKETEDVAREDQIIFYEGGNAMSQIATDLTPEENADMERFTEMFPPVRGITPEPTADETRVIEKLQAEQVTSEETFGKMINAVTVAPVANQDAIAGKPDNTKMRMVQDRTGVIPNGLAGQLTVSGSPHGMHGMFSTILSKMRSVQRQGVTKADAAKAIFAQAFDGKAVHAYTFFDKVRIIDPALITTEKEGGKEYYMFNGSGAASILLNSELGQTFLQDLSEGRRNAEFEAQAAEIISLYGIDPTTFFNRVYAAQTAFGDGNIAAAEKSLNNGRSLIAAITGIGTLTKQEARALENAIINDGALPVKTTGNERLDSRADAMALALNMDKGVARNILYHLVGKHLTSPLDHNAVDDAIDLSDMEFYPQLSMLTDSDYDNGFERLSFQRVGTGNMHNYTSLPFYDQAKDFVARELDKGTFDKDIVAALSRMYPTHLTGFDAKDFFEGIAVRPYRSRVGMDDVSAAVFKLIRHAYRMQWGNAKMELSNIRSFLRDRAYSYDYSIGNDLAPVRQIQRDVEKYLGYLLPKESAAYQKMQLYTSASAFKIDKFTNRFYGDRKALREGKFTDSFISRIAKSAVGSVNEFNTFLVNMHRWERIDRAIDIQERFLVKMYDELTSIAGSTISVEIQDGLIKTTYEDLRNAASALGISLKPLVGNVDIKFLREQVAAFRGALDANNMQSPGTRQQIKDFALSLQRRNQSVTLQTTPGSILSSTPLTQPIDVAALYKQIAFFRRMLRELGTGDKATKLKIARFKDELAQLNQAIGLRDGTDGIVDRFQQYVRSKGINPAGLKPRDLENMPEFADHFAFLREFKGMQIEYLDILRDAGHLNDERYNHLKNGTSGESDVVWDYYTPLVYDEFAFRDEMGFPPTLAESKVATFKIFGVTLLRRKRGNVSPVLKKGPITVGMLDLSNLESPVEVFFHRMASAIKFKERNDAINSLANMLEQTGSNKYANFAARYSIQKDRWGTITSANDLIPDRVKNQSVTYYKDGKRRYLYFADPNDPMLAKLNKGFDDFTSLETFFRPINNIARAAYTYLNPGFIEASLFRDVVEAATNIAVESRGLQLNNFKAKLAKNFTKYYAKSGKFFASSMFGKQDPEMANYYREIQELGGFMSWSFDSMELLRDAETQVKDNIAYAERYAQGRTTLAKANTVFQSTIGAIAKFSNAIEMTPRLATYAALREMGIDPIRAAEAAKNITVNFEKKGADNRIRQLSALYLFLRPSIQGVRKFGKQLYSPEGRKYLIAYATVTAAARSLLYMMPYFAGDDEDEKQNISDKIDRYIYDKWASDTKLLFPNIFDPENPLTIPKPYGGFRISAAIGEGLVDMFAGKKTPVDVKHNVYGQIKGAFDPIAGTSSYFNQWIDAMPLPLFHPVFEAVANVDYQGRPILFDQSGAFDYLKANKGTAQIYHTIAQGVYRHTPGHIDISPTSYEHVIESYAKVGPSRVFWNFQKAMDNLTDPESGKTDAERQSHFAKEILSVNRVLYNPNISEDDKRDLYNYLSMSSAKMGSWNEEKVKYAERAIVLTKQKMLVNPKVIQDSLDDLLSQIVFSGKLYQKVPGQEITWAQWYSAMSSIGDKRSAAQHKRYINDKINKALEESGNQEQEE